MIQYFKYVELYRLSPYIKNHLYHKRYLKRFILYTQKISVIIIANLNIKILRNVILIAYYNF